MNVNRRLQRLEALSLEGVPPQVAAWIASAMYFDELTPEQQMVYCRYRWNTEEPPDKWFARAVPGLEYTDHFQLNRRPQEPSQAELKAIENEISEYITQKAGAKDGKA